ncbi:sigma-70 family RNA polymerase sigma factor [Streptomyces sp. NPDC000987]|uniref:sigma-70 family RNA polymerase sigma factor n=1 Tax=Streptomyces sp. NPDC000987 TaxID=3154374 RepID=UPI00331F7110
MTSSSPETSTRITGAETSPRVTGADRARREARDRAAARTVAKRQPAPPSQPGPPARYEPYLDGLFTYCLSVLCDHDAATAALGDVLALAERRRGPEAAGDRRAWLYALARWACLRKLAEARQKRQSTHAAGRPAGPRQPTAPSVPDAVQQARRRELALLAWPEAAGTTPEQREALELAVRHHLAAHEVAAVLGTAPTAARELLASAACEVERTRAALAVVETGTCPTVARLTGEGRLVLSTALRKELVRHVDDCPRCRRGAERAIPGRWPGASVTPAAELHVLPAPRAALHAAMAHSPRARGAAAPRFDRRGFPMDPRDRAARRARLRTRAVTTTVVATVVAAPVFALWVAYRGAPAGGGADGASTGADEGHGPGRLDGEGAGGGYENAGNADAGPDPRFGGRAGTDVSAEVVGVAGAGRKGAGQIEVSARTSGDTTLITLTATGSAVRWSATTRAPWLYLSRTSGILAPGESVTVRVHVDQLREPAGNWRAQVAVSPAGAVVTIDGRGVAPSPSDHEPSGPATHSPPGPGPTPTTTSAPPDPTPSDQPSSSAPEPTPSGSAPSDPAGSSPPPTDGDPSPSAS